MSVMWVIVLHPYTKFEVHRPSHSEDMDDLVIPLSNLVTLTFDLLTLELVQNVICGMDNFPVNFGVSATFHYRVMGEHFPSVL